jgi:hypothetical protein
VADNPLYDELEGQWRPRFDESPWSPEYLETPWPKTFGAALDLVRRQVSAQSQTQTMPVVAVPVVEGEVVEDAT